MTRSAIASNASPAASDTGLPMTSLRYSMSSTIPPSCTLSCTDPDGAGARQRLRPVRIVASIMPSLSPFTLAALRAAVAAGEVHRAFFGKLARVDYKGRNDPVTEADRAAEATIVRTIQQAYPDHGFLGEEGGRQGEEGPYTWLVDPLDGTFNYARAIPHFAS